MSSDCTKCEYGKQKATGQYYCVDPEEWVDPVDGAASCRYRAGSVPEPTHARIAELKAKLALLRKEIDAKAEAAVIAEALGSTSRWKFETGEVKKLRAELAACRDALESIS